jgi:hypothetical protein
MRMLQRLFLKMLHKMQNILYIMSKKYILQVLTKRVQDAIYEEIDDSKFCIIVDVTQDESKRE